MMRRPKLTSAQKKGPTFFDNSDSQSAPYPKSNRNSGDSAVFDNLSKTLSDHARALTGETVGAEKVVRAELLASLRDYKLDRSKLGGILIRYKTFYKSRRHWTRVVTEIGKSVEMSARTVFRIIEECDPQRGKPAEESIDTMAIDGPPLSKRERLERDARLAIRALLNDLERAEKREALLRILAEEAHQIWGETTRVTLTFVPTPSRFTMDGRKKADHQVSAA